MNLSCFFFFFNDTATTEIYPLFLHLSLFFFNDTAPTEIYTLSLHDALPIWSASPTSAITRRRPAPSPASPARGWTRRFRPPRSTVPWRRRGGRVRRPSRWT